MQKKEKLYATKEIGRWDLDKEKSKSVPREELLRDKAKAFTMMLFQESTEVKAERDMAIYMNTAVYNETVRGFNARCFLLRNNFRDFANKQAEYMKKLEGIWDNLLDDPAETRTRGKARTDLFNSQISMISGMDQSSANMGVSRSSPNRRR